MGKEKYTLKWFDHVERKMSGEFVKVKMKE